MIFHLVASNTLILNSISASRKSTDILTLDDGVHRYKVPETLLYTNTTIFVACSDYVKIKNFIHYENPGAFRLFVEFMFTGSWSERSIPVDFSNAQLEYATSAEANMEIYKSDWKLKAAVHACKMACYLQASSFHDYAMQQVFQYFYRDGYKLDPELAEFAWDKECKLSMFVYDLIILAWDKNVGIIDREDGGWQQFIVPPRHKHFNDRCIMDVGKRGENLNVGTYLRAGKDGEYFTAQVIG
jgi:hypothetical protein